MSKSWPKVRLGDVLRPVARPLDAKPDETYREIGIRSHGKGVFHKVPVSGLEIGGKRVFWMQPGDFVLNIVFAWEGAVAVLSEAEAGMIGSHRFPTFRADELRLDSRFLLAYLKTQEGRTLLGKVSPGGAGRNRTLSKPAFLNQLVPLPPLVQQRRVVVQIEELSAQIHEARAVREQAVAETDRLYATQLAASMDPHGEGWERATVADVLLSLDAGWSPQCDDVPARGDQWGVLKTTAVQWCEFRAHENKALPSALEPLPALCVQEGDVLVTRAGPRKRVGVVAAVRKTEPRLTISDKLIRLRPNPLKVAPRFLELSLASPFSQEHLVNRKTGLADAQVNITQAILRATPIAYPRSLRPFALIASLNNAFTAPSTIRTWARMPWGPRSLEGMVPCAGLSSGPSSPPMPPTDFFVPRRLTRPATGSFIPYFSFRMRSNESFEWTTRTFRTAASFAGRPM